MMRKERIADRLAAARLKEAEEDEAFAAGAAGAAGDGGTHSISADEGKANSQMVFGDGKWDAPLPNVFQNLHPADATATQAPVTKAATAASDGFQYDDESSDEEGVCGDDDGNGDGGAELTAHGKIKREHKGRKQWGKKNRKLRDKTPYGEASVKVNVSAIGGSRLAGSTGSGSYGPSLGVSRGSNSSRVASRDACTISAAIDASNHQVGVKDRNKTGYKLARSDLGNAPQRGTTLRQRYDIPNAAANGSGSASNAGK